MLLQYWNVLSGKLLYVVILTLISLALKLFESLLVILNHQSHIFAVELITR